MRQNDWTELLRQRLAESNADVPDGLWDKIEARLDNAEAESKQHSLRRGRAAKLMAWAMAAAAAVAIFLVSVYNSNENSNELMARNGTARGMAESMDGNAGNKGTAYKRNSEHMSIAYRSATRYNHAANTHDGALLLYSNTEECRSNGNADSQQPDNAAQQQHEPSCTSDEPQSPNSTSDTHTPTSSNNLLAYNANQTRHTARRNSQWSVGAHSDGVFGESNSYSQPLSAALLTASPSTCQDKHQQGCGNSQPDNTNGRQYPLLLARYSESKHHAKPISVGVTVAYSLNSRMAITSGLVYTQASADFATAAGNDNVVSTQKLHYVGVPIGLRYTIWANRYVRTYGAASAQADFNVAAKMTTANITTDIAKDRPQLSAGAAAGVQLNATPNLGIYAEPGVRYYFDNKSGVETIFKERPWAFNLQLGIRVDL